MAGESWSDAHPDPGIVPAGGALFRHRTSPTLSISAGWEELRNRDLMRKSSLTDWADIAFISRPSNLLPT